LPVGPARWQIGYARDLVIDDGAIAHSRPENRVSAACERSNERLKPVNADCGFRLAHEARLRFVFAKLQSFGSSYLGIGRFGKGSKRLAIFSWRRLCGATSEPIEE
jgi:hypothetical protein